MEQRLKQNSFRPSDSMYTRSTYNDETTVKSASIREYSNERSQNSFNSKAKLSYFRYLLNMLPFMSSNKQKLAKKQNKWLKHQLRASPKTRSNISLEDGDVRKLIRLYYDYDNLYNPANPQYGNESVNNICYAEMAKAFPNRTPGELRSYIHELRLLFEREYSIIENARRRYGEVLAPSIKFYSEFLFLVPFVVLQPDSASGSRLTKSMGMSADSFKTQSENRTTAGKSHIIKQPSWKAPIAYDSNAMSGMEFWRKRKGKRDVRDNPSDVISGTEEKNETPKEQQQSKDKQKSQKPQHDQTQDGALSEPRSQYSQTDHLQEPTEQPQPAQSNSQAGSNSSTPVRKQSQPPAEEKPPGNSANCPCPQSVRQEVAPRRQTQNAVAAALESSQAQCNRDTRIVCVQPVNDGRLNCLAVIQMGPQGAHHAEAFDHLNGSDYSDSGGNREQLQILCDMIRLELGSAPDGVYFDAKWRIIEILRDVNKRRMSADPNNGPENNQLEQLCASAPANAPKKSELVRACARAGHCPYCCHR